ncbi:MAG: response regulator [Candidatus Diapherotrites archaeon]
MANILIVDDEENVSEAMKDLLKAGGYKVDAAKNCDDALKKIEKQNFDLILLDIMMPGMPVKEFVSKLADNPKTAKMKIVYVSAMSLAGEKSDGKNYVIDPISLRFNEIDKRLAVGFLKKPFSNERLLNVVAGALSK